MKIILMLAIAFFLGGCSNKSENIVEEIIDGTPTKPQRPKSQLHIGEKDYVNHIYQTIRIKDTLSGEILKEIIYYDTFMHNRDRLRYLYKDYINSDSSFIECKICHNKQLIDKIKWYEDNPIFSESINYFLKHKKGFYDSLIYYDKKETEFENLDEKIKIVKNIYTLEKMKMVKNIKILFETLQKNRPFKTKYKNRDFIRISDTTNRSFDFSMRLYCHYLENYKNFEYVLNNMKAPNKKYFIKVGGGDTRDFMKNDLIVRERTLFKDDDDDWQVSFKILNYSSYVIGYEYESPDIRVTVNNINDFLHSSNPPIKKLYYSGKNQLAF